MLYAVVDIETNGGTPSNSRITEICVVVTDGYKVLHEFETLLNPGSAVPRSITALTGITNEMLETAPVFAEIAGDLHHLLHDKVFVAHNVNFDYGFIHKEFEQLGMPFSVPKICTVKTSRKAFPGKRSYGLGSICASLNIEIENRHRAGGDARATTELFHKIADVMGIEALEEQAGRNYRKLVLPPAVDTAEIEKLPSTPGVYFFLNTSGKPLYVGKAINIQKRVLQHFDPKRGKTALQLEKIAHIDFEETGSELMALLTEAEAINRLWPEWNKAAKFPANRYSLVHYLTIHGELRLQVIRRARNSPGGIGFSRLTDARNALAKMIGENGICFSLAQSNKTCKEVSCYCLEPKENRREIHNSRIQQALEAMGKTESELFIVCRGRTDEEKGLVYMADGTVMGWGFVETLNEESVIYDDPFLYVKKIKDLSETRAIGNAFLRRIVSGAVHGYKVIPINIKEVKEQPF